MKTTIADAIRGLNTLREQAIRGAENGLAAACPDIAVALRATDRHGDQTGATRAGYTAGVVGPNLDTLTPAVSRSRAEVEARNPGRSFVGSAGTRGAAEVVVILTSPTDYQEKLSGDSGGAKDALGPTLQQQADRLAAAAATGIRKAL